MPEISHKRVLEVLRYEPSTGEFSWRIKTGKSVVVGKRAGSVDPNGFRYIRIDKKDFLAQRLAWFYVHGEWPQRKLKQRNGDRDDNRFENLVEVAGSGKFPGLHDFSTSEGRAAYNKAHREANPDIYRDKYLRRQYGIGLAEYNQLLISQNGVCAICGEPEQSKRNGKLKLMAVDHNHATGAVRALLCGTCNPMIGYAKDDPVRLIAAAEYVRRGGAVIGPDHLICGVCHKPTDSSILAVSHDGQIMGRYCDACRAENLSGCAA